MAIRSMVFLGSSFAFTVAWSWFCLSNHRQKQRARKAAHRRIALPGRLERILL
jgi:hypothetical protein